MSSGSLINIQDLSVEFTTESGIIKAVDDISFSSAKGMTTGIVGESGSGKSVTALSIMGLLPSPPGKIAGGKILFNPGDEDVDLTGMSDKKMRSIRGNHIGMIFQEPMTSLNPVFSCGNQITEVIREHKDLSRREAKYLCIRLFEEVHLPRPGEIFNSYPHQLSGGQKQRVMIAMAIACEPSLLIADEPTTALDVSVQKNILRLLQDLQQKHGMGMLFITHDLGVVSEIASEVVVMYHGKIVESGSVGQIFNHPEHPYTKGLIACRPPLDYRPSKLLTVKDFIESDASHGEELSAAGLKKAAESRKSLHKQIYSGEPMLKAVNLSTLFSLKKNLLGRSKDFVRAVDRVNLEVFRGETMGLVGESGCGKTTLGRTILKLIEPASGDILYKGKNIVNARGSQLRDLRKKFQIIFQDPYSSLNPRITIGNAIAEPMIVHKISSGPSERNTRVASLLEQVGLSPEFAGRYPHELSGGQRQRVCIARALAVDPEFIICDESVSALDVSIQAQVLNLLNELKQKLGLTYIFISHDLSVVKYMSDRMAIMQNGKIIESGDPDEIYNSPENEYTLNLIKAIPGTTETHS
jgi:peptide/nickel transport system ATP-binding protein